MSRRYRPHVTLSDVWYGARKQEGCNNPACDGRGVQPGGWVAGNTCEECILATATSLGFTAEQIASYQEERRVSAVLQNLAADREWFLAKAARDACKGECGNHH